MSTKTPVKKAAEEKSADKPAEKKTAAKAKAPAAKKPTGTKVDAPAKGAKPNALQQPLQPSAELAAVVGEAKLARGEVVSKIWEYIKANDLQDPKDKRQILADDKLKAIFGGEAKVSMFAMNKHIAQHLK